MTEFSKIEWCDHTFNPWWGCVRVSPACRFCYADTQARRYGHQVWRKRGPRRLLSDANWAKPLKWNRDAKRPENIAAMAPWGAEWPPHVWVGTSVENQRFAEERIPILLRVPAAVLFLSCEPLLGPVDLRNLCDANGALIDCLTGEVKAQDGREVHASAPNSVSWVITGGESGSRARPTELAWIRSLIEQCRDAHAAPFVKQLGTAWAGGTLVSGRSIVGWGDRKGSNPLYWDVDLRVREMPHSVGAVA